MKMGFKMYSSFEEARRDQWIFTPDEEYYRKIREFYQFASRLSPPKCKVGITKFRNIAELQKFEKESITHGI
jgi:hypothetical protein